MPHELLPAGDRRAVAAALAEAIECAAVQGFAQRAARVSSEQRHAFERAGLASNQGLVEHVACADGEEVGTATYWREVRGLQLESGLGRAAWRRLGGC